jgi:alanine racemase
MYNRPTYLEINLNALKHNFDYLKKVSNKEIFAVVKANAYGHGMIGISKFLDQLQCAYICVSSLDEAIRLRNKGVISPLLILGYTKLTQQVINVVSKNKITLTVISLEWFKELLKFDLTSTPITLHIEVDTGMNRLGFKDLSEVQLILSESSNLNVTLEGIYTHFHSSDKNDGTMNNQFESFKSILNTLSYPFKWIHTANSDAIFNLEDNISNAIRPGLALYGYSSVKSELIPIMHFYSQITQKKLLKKHESVSYGATYTAQEDMWIGIVPVGYADGLPIGLSNNFEAYIDNVSCPIIGKICMDQLMIKIPQNSSSDLVTISGLINNFETMAKLTNTITYEVLTCLNIRIHRIFRYNEAILFEE